MRARAEVNDRLRRDRGWKTWHWALDEPRSADNGGGPGVGPRKVWTGPASAVESDQRDLKRPVASARPPKRRR